MKLNVIVTLLGTAVLMLASINTASAANAPSTSANTQTTSTTQAKKTETKETETQFHIAASVTRSTNLIDFQDGSRSDSMDYQVSPSLKMSIGTLSTSLSYSQDLKDESSTASDIGDIPLKFSFNRTKLDWFETKQASLGYSLTAVIPASKMSVKKDELKTAISGAVSFSVTPKDGEGFSYSAGLSVGQNIHAYEEDINGSVLNKYSSNQSIALGYAISNWSFDVSFANRTRLTYKNSTKSSFEISEEISYAINDNFGAAIGHSNSGASLKPNGTDTNIDLINENSSVVYASLNVTY